MTRTLKRVTELKYRIYTEENGLLIQPKDSWGDHKYNNYYDTIEEALVDINAYNETDLLILPVAITSWE